MTTRTCACGCGRTFQSAEGRGRPRLYFEAECRRTVDAAHKRAVRARRALLAGAVRALSDDEVMEEPEHVAWAILARLRSGDVTPTRQGGQWRGKGQGRKRTLTRRD